jgi:hypothetical protein
MGVNGFLKNLFKKSDKNVDTANEVCIILLVFERKKQRRRQKNLLVKAL